MDPKEFLHKLSQVSEWHRPQTGPNGQPSTRKGWSRPEVEHPGDITPEELEAMTDSEAQAYYEQLMAWRESQPNDTVPPEVIRVKTQAKNCEDCDRYCPEGRRTERKLHHTGKAHWRELCTTCEMYRDPATGKFTLPKLGSHQYFNSFYRPKLGIYKSKYQSQVEKPKEPREKQPRAMSKTEIINKIIAEGTWHTRETEDNIIRTFEPKK